MDGWFLGLDLVFVFFLGLEFCVLCFSLDYFVFVLFAFVVLGLISYYAKMMAWWNVSEMTYFVSSGM